MTKPRFAPRVCQECGREFAPTNGRQLFCTAACKTTALRRMAGAREKTTREWTMHRRVCPICGTEFEARGKQAYCSLRCRKKAAYQRMCEKQGARHDPDVTAICPVCGREFPAMGKGGYLKKLCSAKCRLEYKRVKAWEASARRAGRDPDADMKHACIVCGATFVARSRRARYCSDECKAVAAAAYQRRHYREKHPEPTSPRHAVVSCPVCGAAFQKQSYTHRYCSERCRDAAYRKRHHLAPGDRDRQCVSRGETFESVNGRVTCSSECARWHEIHRRLKGPWPYAVRECALCGEEFRAFGDETLCAFCSANGKTPRGNNRMGEFVRHCHDCGRVTTQYRCPSCLARWRKRHGVTEYALAGGDDA